MRLAVDKKKCVGCKLCEIVCSAVHLGAFNPKRAQIKLHFGHPLPEAPLICHQCKDAACIKACPAEALFTDSRGIVQYGREKCTACYACVAACPFHALFADEKDHTIRKCNVCDGDAPCIGFCQKGALSIK